MPEPLLLQRQGAVAIIAIDDAPYNRMSLELIDQLEVLVGEIAADATIRAVVLTGQGLDNFSVGMNLKQLAAGIARMGGEDALFDQRLRVIKAIETMAEDGTYARLPKKEVAGLERERLGGEIPHPAKETERSCKRQAEQAKQPAHYWRRVEKMRGGTKAIITYRSTRRRNHELQQLAGLPRKRWRPP